MNLDRFDDDWISDEDEEDERELEIALYSQIHFEQVPEVTTHNDDVDFQKLQYHVGIEEISLPLRTDHERLNAVRRADDAINVSSDEGESVEFVLSEPNIIRGSSNPFSVNSDKRKKNNANDEPIDCDENDLHIDDDIEILEAYSKLEESLTTPNKSDDEPHSLVQGKGDTDKNKDLGLSEHSLKRKKKAESSPTSPSILPFSITKTPILRLKSDPSSSDSSDKESESKSVSHKEKNLADKNPFNLSSKKEGFLKFSESVKKDEKNVIKLKKKKLSKQEAAVRPRKPPICIRKPPFVRVSYHQDSDTNTDYSDSDISPASTPKKKVSQKSATPSKDADRVCLEKEYMSSSSNTDTSFNSNSTSEEKEERLSKKCKPLKNSKEVRKRKAMGKSDTDTDSSSSTEDIQGDVHDSSLDFNIEGGVNSLLKGNLEKSGLSENWQISDKDRYQILVTSSRYFSPKAFTCRNCNEEGHKAVDCPQPKKSMCIFCGLLGHVYQRCPNNVCYNCQAPGHQAGECRERKRTRKTECGRCWMPGHFEEDCPDIWRQYHLTCTSEARNILKSKKHCNTKVYCHNCGREGHHAFDCREMMMNSFIFPNYPFIANYDRFEPKHERDRDSRRREERLKGKKSQLRHEDDTNEREKKYGSRERRREQRKIEGSKNNEKRSNTKSSKANSISHTSNTTESQKNSKSSLSDTKKSKRKKESTEKPSKKRQHVEPEKDHSPKPSKKSKRHMETEKDVSEKPSKKGKKHMDPEKKSSKKSKMHMETEKDASEKPSIKGERHTEPEKIMTGNTVYSFQEPTKYDYEEGECHSEDGEYDYEEGECISDPGEIHFQDRNDGNVGHYSRSANFQQPPKSSLRGKSGRNQQPKPDDESEKEMMRHQVFHNEWWKGDSKAKRNKKQKGSATPMSPSASSSRSNRRSIDFEEENRQHDHAPQHRTKRMKKTSHNIPNLEVTFNNRQQAGVSSRNENPGNWHKNKAYQKSGSHGYKKRLKKSGFQMKSHFHSLSRNCER